MTARKDNGLRRDLYFWFSIVAIMFVGAVLVALRFRLNSNDSWKAVGEISGAFGEALLIAGVLATTVDRFVKFRVIQEVLSDVWQYLANHRVPVELSDYLHDSLQDSMIRRNLTIKYTLTRAIGGKIRADVDIGLRFENYGNQAVPLELAINEEAHKQPVFEEITCISNDPAAAISPAEGRILILTHPQPGVDEAKVKGHEKISVKPIHESQFYEVHFKYRLERVQESDGDVLSFKGPTIDVTIEASVPPEITFEPPRTDFGGGGRWIYKQVFLKQQHLHVRWFPTPTLP